MVTISFVVCPEEVQAIRAGTRRERMTVSEPLHDGRYHAVGLPRASSFAGVL
jgi:hypothetical protein